MDVFASRLRERAAELGVSHAAVARRCGLSERRYGHYVSGIREPDLATLVRIAEALQTTPDVLLGVSNLTPISTRSRFLGRLMSAAQLLENRDLEIISVQVEAVVNHHELRTRKLKT